MPPLQVIEYYSKTEDGTAAVLRYIRLILDFKTKLKVSYFEIFFKKEMFKNFFLNDWIMSKSHMQETTQPLKVYSIENPRKFEYKMLSLDNNCKIFNYLW